MGSLFQFRQKLRGFRGFSTGRGTCVIRGRSQDIFFPDRLWESLDDHAAHSPLVSRVQGRLIKVKPSTPFQISDHWRKILFSGLVHSFICKRMGDCIHNAFDLNNVGVIRGLNILGFRRFERRVEMKNANHNEYVRFVQNLFSEVCDPWTLQKVRDIRNFLLQFSRNLPDEYLLGNPVFLDDEETASFYVDVHRLVRHEFPIRGPADKSLDILEDMETYWSNDECVKACGGTFFQYLTGSHEKSAASIKRFKEPIYGSAVIDIPRIIVSHCIERDLLKRAREHSVGVKHIHRQWHPPLKPIKYGQH